MSGYADFSGLEISGVDFGADDSLGADIASELRAALSGVDFGADEFGADSDALGALAEMGADADTLGAVAEEIGRRRARRGGRRAAPRRPMARPVARPAMIARPPERAGAAVLGGFGSPSSVNTNARPSHVGGRILPITSGSVAAGTTAVLTLNPQDDFRPERLIYAGAATTFSISDVRIKNVPQTISAGDVPADAFSPNAVDQRLNFSACPVGGQIQMSVFNFSGGAAIFRGMFVGSAAIQ